jgi:ribosomal protein S18 acetylase RimI-like enzyme
MNITIRDARPADGDLIADFNGRMAVETEDKTLDPETTKAGVAGLLADAARGRYWLAEIDGEVAGQLMVTYEWSDWRNGTIWWIQSVYVRQRFRRAGVFSALYNHVKSMAQEDQGVCGIRLYVEKDNENAQATYQKLGMTETDYRVMEIIF